MSFNFMGRRFSVWVPVMALLTVLGLCFLLALWIYMSQPGSANQVRPSADFTVIAAPSTTPLPITGEDVSLTVTPGSDQAVGGISVGMYVQITGTEGDGLRLRSAPGTNSTPRFLGRDSEVFQVKDGPRDADGYTWWYLVTPMDESRSGWAASKYLAVVAEPTTAP